MAHIFEAIHETDMNILHFIERFRFGLLDQIMIFISWIGNVGIIWIVLSLCLLATKKYRKVGLFSLIALLIGTIITDLTLKEIFARQRPYTHIPDYALLIEEESTMSFPSGHTTAAFACAGVVAYYLKKARLYILFGASLMALSRMYLFVHFPSDIVAGIIVGLTGSTTAILLEKSYHKNRKMNSTIEPIMQAHE
jgi:undecaprenyl-diphosphatase